MTSASLDNLLLLACVADEVSRFEGRLEEISRTIRTGIIPPEDEMLTPNTPALLNYTDKFELRKAGIQDFLPLGPTIPVLPASAPREDELWADSNESSKGKLKVEVVPSKHSKGDHKYDEKLDWEQTIAAKISTCIVELKAEMIVSYSYFSDSNTYCLKLCGPAFQ
ncbi:hypothetical protein VNI00_012193 [Paramarasmius palmivorus]|uniref:Uncharacterized protein n=1 Tax=Paramarasmius palmivorus TaxID=297713 RepID=A0AAW0C6B6_9AGAR